MLAKNKPKDRLLQSSFVSVQVRELSRCLGPVFGWALCGPDWEPNGVSLPGSGIGGGFLEGRLQSGCGLKKHHPPLLRPIPHIRTLLPHQGDQTPDPSRGSPSRTLKAGCDLRVSGRPTRAV